MTRLVDCRIVLGMLVLLVGPGYSQDYQVLPIAEQFDLAKIQAEPEANGDAKEAAKILRRRITQQEANARKVFQPSAPLNDAFKAYYTRVVIPGLTRYDRDSLKELTENHHRLLKEFGTKIRNTSAHAYLVREAYFPLFSQIVEGNFHPVVRYNAILSIGKLDEVVGKHGLTAPRPYRESLGFLVKKFNDFKDPKDAYLKYGAFKGIARIASLDYQTTAPTTRGTTQPIFTSFLAAKPANMNQDLFESMQRTSVEVLGLLGDPVMGDSFAALINNPATPVWTKAEAALAISKIKSNNYDLNKLDTTAQAMAKLMHDVLRAEIKSLDYDQKRLAVLAARKKEIGQDASTAGGFRSNQGSSAEDRAGGLASGGGSGGATPGSGGASPGSGGASPGSGAGRSGRSGRSGFSMGGATELEDLPAYRIKLARRRVKTVSASLVSAFGETAGTSGILRWVNSAGDAAMLTKISTFKGLMVDADKATEAGLEDDANLVTGATDLLRTEFELVADRIAEALGIAKPKKAAKPKAKKAKSGDSFLNN